MKKLLIVLGAIFLGVLVIGGAGIGYLVFTGSALDHESKVYADAAIQAIVARWDQSELEKRESPEFRSVTTASDLDRLFRAYRRLGNLKGYNDLKGDANISVTSQKGTQITARYIAAAEFDTGPAQIDVGLVKHGDQWQILRFNVSSKVFLEGR